MPTGTSSTPYGQALRAYQVRVCAWLGLNPEHVINIIPSDYYLITVTQLHRWNKGRDDLLTGPIQTYSDGISPAQARATYLLTQEQDDDLFRHAGPQPRPPGSLGIGLYHSQDPDTGLWDRDLRSLQQHTLTLTPRALTGVVRAWMSDRPRVLPDWPRDVKQLRYAGELIADLYAGQDGPDAVRLVRYCHLAAAELADGKPGNAALHLSALSGRAS